MAKLTENIVALLRVMHAGVPLRVLPKGRALLDVGGLPPGVRRATVVRLEKDGLIAFDETTDRYTITDAGRDEVRVRDGVDELIDGASPEHLAS